MAGVVVGRYWNLHCDARAALRPAGQASFLAKGRAKRQATIMSGKIGVC